MTETTIHALVVEDDPSWQEILNEILTDAGLAVDVVDNAEAAVESLRKVPYRLAVVDLSLHSEDHRNRDGLRVLDAARRYAPGSVTLLLTGYATVELAVSALTEHGAFTCLRKETFSRSSFRELVQQALASASPRQHGTAAQENGGVGDGSPAQAVAAAPSPTVEQVLVVEDDAGWRNILSELLEEAGYEVCQCGGFGEALGCLGRERYALAVVDLSLSGLGPGSQADRASEQDLEGHRLLSSARAAGIPTIVVSGVAASAEIERLYNTYGVFACLEKQTFDRQTFLHTVSEVRAASQPSSELDSLTEREGQVLGLLVQGMTNKEIASTLMISTNTVKRHLKAVFEKLEVHTRSAAVARAINAGLAAGWVGQGDPGMS